MGGDNLEFPGWVSDLGVLNRGVWFLNATAQYMATVLVRGGVSGSVVKISY